MQVRPDLGVVHDGTDHPIVNAVFATGPGATAPRPEMLPPGCLASVTSFSGPNVLPLGGGNCLVPTVPAAPGTGTVCDCFTAGSGRGAARRPRGPGRFPDFAVCHVCEEGMDRRHASVHSRRN